MRHSIENEPLSTKSPMNKYLFDLFVTIQQLNLLRGFWIAADFQDLQQIVILPMETLNDTSFICDARTREYLRRL